MWKSFRVILQISPADIYQETFILICENGIYRQPLLWDVASGPTPVAHLLTYSGVREEEVGESTFGSLIYNKLWG